MLPREQELELRAVRGDFDALGELLQVHAASLRRDLTTRFGQRLQPILDAEDVIQVTYMEAFLHIRHFVPRGDGAFAAWLQRIARNNLRDAVREIRRGKRPQSDRRIEPAAASSSATMPIDRLIGQSDTPSGEAACHERARILKDVIAQLPSDYRRVVELCDIEGRSTSEAAASLNRSQGAVCMLRARARDRLRELLGSESRYFSDSG